MHNCSSCGAPCSGTCACGEVFYCGAACQRAHWPMHRPACDRGLVRAAEKRALANADADAQLKTLLVRAFGYHHSCFAGDIARWMRFQKTANYTSGGTESFHFWKVVAAKCKKVVAFHLERATPNVDVSAYAQAAEAAIGAIHRTRGREKDYTCTKNVHGIALASLEAPDYAAESAAANAWLTFAQMHHALMGYRLDECVVCRKGKLVLRYIEGSGGTSYPELGCSACRETVSTDVYIGPTLYDADDAPPA